jgi:phosphohistidine phosphatase SixA
MFGGHPLSKQYRIRLKFLTVISMAVALSFIFEKPAIANEADIWAALRKGGHVALLRHAIAPGTGDPNNFVIGDCRTQRNLSDEGRAQAKRIGDRFRANGIASAPVFSSQWCRCLQTARLLTLGPVIDLPSLNSFFENFEQRQPQTRALKAWLKDQDLRLPQILVTHQVNITALTGIYPSSGELVVVRKAKNGALTVVGTIQTD